MAKHSIFLAISLLLLSIPSYAQSFQQKYKEAEAIKLQYGQRDTRYLTALTDAIQAAFDAEDYATAKKYRQVHIDIVKEMYGTKSKEYAEDLFRMGNVNFRLNDIEAAKVCYESAVTAYESTGVKDSFYTTALFQLDDILDRLKDYSSKLVLDQKLEQLVISLGGEKSDDYVDITYRIGYDYSKLADAENCLNYWSKCLQTIISQYEGSDKNIKSDSRYQMILEVLVSLYDIFEQEDATFPMREELLSIYQFNGDESSETYLENLKQLMKYYYTHNDFSNIKAYAEKWEALTKNLKGDGSADHLKALSIIIDTGWRSQMAGYQDFMKPYIEKAENAIQRSNASAYDRFTLQYSITCAYSNMQDMPNSIKAYDSLRKMIDAGIPEVSVDINAECYNIEGTIYDQIDKVRAMEAYKKSIELHKSQNHVDWTSYNNLGKMYLEAGQYSEAIENLNTSALILEDLGRTNSAEYVMVAINQALCLMNMGQVSEGANVLAYIEASVSNTFGEESALYGTILQNKAVYYNLIMDFKNALDCSLKAAEIYGKINDGNNDNYPLIIQNIGLMYSKTNQLEEAEKWLTMAADRLSKRFGPDNSYLMMVYTNLYGTYLGQGKTAEADKMLGECKRIIEVNGLQNSEQAMVLYGTIGYTLLIKKDPLSKSYLAKTLEIMKSLGIDNKSEYFYYLISYYASCFMDKYPDESCIKSIYEEYVKQYNTNYAYLKAQDRDSFLSGPEFNLVLKLLFWARRTDTYNDTLYDYLLFNKGLLLDTSVSFEGSIMKSGDQDLISQLERMKKMKAQIRTIESKGGDKAEADSLRKLSSTIESYLLGSVQERFSFAEQRQCHYADIESALNKDEVSIEFVEYDDKYAALIGRNGWSKPKYVPLCNKQSLDEIVGQSPSDIYGKGSNGTLYQLIWKPLEDIMHNGETVYFSPSGLLHTIALEAICTPKGKTLAETYNLIRCSSTRIVLDKANKVKASSARLYGGLVYDEDVSAMERNAKVYGVASCSESWRGADPDQTRSSWTYLPGTLKEVGAVADLMKEHSLSATVLTEGKGNEESFKSMSGSSPNILHIATHGFFLNEDKAAKTDFLAYNPYINGSITAMTKSDQYTSSMMRSGLMLSGCNAVWKGKAIPDGIEDGILTAAEISDLNLQGTDLLALSACETGLGDVSDEGVFGLQRAFKIAGVKTIMMSLWDVSDSATALMMEEFYKNYLSGKSKREAFIAAQAEVRKKYEDPAYWAAFILLD